MTAAIRSIGRIKLQAEHAVYDNGGRYLVDSGVRNDPSRAYAQPVSRTAVQSVHRMRTRWPSTTIEGIFLDIEARGTATVGFQCRSWQPR